jgi:hypothetical protein
LKINLDKLKKSKLKLEKALDEIKFPVPDQLITAIDTKGPTPLPLPALVFNLDLDDHLVADVLMIWDFLFTFRCLFILFLFVFMFLVMNEMFVSIQSRNHSEANQIGRLY